MTSQLDSARATYRAGADLGRHLRVIADAAGVVTVAAIGDAETGTMARFTPSGHAATVLLNNKEGTMIYIASGAISAGATVGPDNGGMVKAGTGIGTARSATTGTGQLIEVLRT